MDPRYPRTPRAPLDATPGGQGPRPIIILGAARSGTKLVRDLLAVSSDTAPIGFDVNYLWRYGHQRHPDDALPASFATDRVRTVIRRRLSRMAGAAGADGPRLLEKTVSNTLRVPFVHAVVPEAMFVIITRDGRDVVESAVRCWQAAPRPALRKLRGFPWASAMPYAVNYVGNAARRIAGGRTHLGSWGPRYSDIDEHVRTRPLVEVCALQWAACMNHLAASLSAIPADQRVTVRYESLVRAPTAEMTHLATAIGLREPQRIGDRAREIVSSDTVGAHQRLARDDLRTVESLLGETLGAWGYLDAAARAAGPRA